jgi:hypothetical protein
MPIRAKLKKENNSQTRELLAPSHVPIPYSLRIRTVGIKHPSTFKISKSQVATLAYVKHVYDSTCLIIFKAYIPVS